MNKNKRKNESRNKNKVKNNSKSKNIDRAKERNRINNDDNKSNFDHVDNYDLDNENDTITINNNASVEYKDENMATTDDSKYAYDSQNQNNDEKSDINDSNNSTNNRRREKRKKENKYEQKNKKSKRNIFLSIIILILIVALIIMSIELYLSKNNNEFTEETSYYGQRGNISNAEKIMFLSKEDDYLIGMMGLEYSTEEVEFDNDSMTRFALYIAQERYSNLLTMEQEFDGSYNYRIDTEIIDDIIEEFFGVTGIIYSVEDNEYYSQSRGYFLFNEQFEKSMWFYPINEDTVEVAIEDTISYESSLSDDKYSSSESLEDKAYENIVETYEESASDNEVNGYNSTNESNGTNLDNSLTSKDESSVTQSYIVITADAIYIDEILSESDYQNAKYEGMYDEDCVEYTIKLKFDEKGYLVSYQYVE